MGRRAIGINSQVNWSRRSVWKIILTCRICVPWCCSNKSNAKPAAVRLDEAPGREAEKKWGLDADQEDNSIKTSAATGYSSTGQWINIIIRKGVASSSIHYGISFDYRKSGREISTGTWYYE